jgi:AcrR family transcriptional regulator
MPTTRTPREQWVEEGLRVLADRGPDAVRIEPLAKALGVSKGGFYWHFENRDALLEAMLEAWERSLVDAVIEEVDAVGGADGGADADADADARARLWHLFALAAQAEELRRIDLAMRDWARRDAGVAARLRRLDNRRMDYMRSLFGALCADPDEVEVRCLLAFAVFVGNDFIAAEHGDRTRAQVLRRTLEHLLAPCADGSG